MMNNDLVRRPRSPTSLWRPSETAWECLLEASTCSQNMGWSAFCPFLMPKGSLQRGSKQRKRKCNGKWKILDCKRIRLFWDFYAFPLSNPTKCHKDLVEATRQGEIGNQNSIIRHLALSKCLHVCRLKDAIGCNRQLLNFEPPRKHAGRSRCWWEACSLWSFVWTCPELSRGEILKRWWKNWTVSSVCIIARNHLSASPKNEDSKCQQKTLKSKLSQHIYIYYIRFI